MKLIAQEATFLDRRMWEEWLALYRDDAVFWIPAWRNEAEETDDPEREVSLIYYDSKLGLRERVARIRSGHSVVSAPLPRTAHIATGVLAEESEGAISATASWMVNVYYPTTHKHHAFFGLYDYVFKQEAGSWKIKKKKVSLMNDCIPSYLDIYCV